jgi:hypothetical protein
MNKLRQNQQGLIPLILSILFVVGFIIYFAYIKVLHAQN